MRLGNGVILLQTTVSPMASPSQLGLATEEGKAHQRIVVVPPCTVCCGSSSPAMPEGRGTLQKDAEALVIALDQTKQKLKLVQHPATLQIV